MKVPQYKERIARSKAGGGVFLTAQANPNAWGAMGRALSDVGDTVYNLGLEKYKIQAQADVNETMPVFLATIDSIKEKHKNSRNPIQAEIKIKNEMMKVYKDFSSGIIKNGVGEAYLSSSLSKSAFGTKASPLVTAGILAWKKQNNAYILETKKTNDRYIISQHDKLAADTTQNIETRMAAYDANHSVSSLYKKIPGQTEISMLSIIAPKSSSDTFSNYQGMPGGKFAQLAIGGDFKAKEFLVMQKKSLENVVTGISLNLIKSKTHPSMSVTEVLVKGNAEQLTAVDPILAKVWEQLLPEDKLDFIKKVRTLENNRKKDVEDAKKEKADALKAGDEKLKIEIINADYSNPEAKAEAFIKFKTLLKNEVFEKSAERNALESFFEVDDPSGEIKTDNAVFRMLDLLDDQNKLTKKIINDSFLKLKTSDYRAFIKRLKVEKTDAESYVINTVINGSFFIDELNSDDESAVEFDKMRMAAKNAFNKWLENNGTASYSEIVAQGEEIMKSPKEQIAKMYKAGFDNEVKKFKAVDSLKNSFEKKYLDKKYTLNRIMSHLVDLGLSKAQPKSYAKRFKNFIGLPGANEWNE